MNEVKLFENKELNLQVRTITNPDGSISVNAEDTAIGYGWYRTENKNGKEYVSIMWSRMNGYSKELGFAHECAKEDYIPESLFYMLGFKAGNEKALKYQKWIAMEVLPSLRKTGTYTLTKSNQNQVTFKEIAEVIPLIAADLQVNRISHLIMYKNLCNDYGVPSGFLPVYVEGGDREKKPLTDLLKEMDSPISSIKFNKMLVKAGILEERSRKSTSSKSGVKQYKSLTEEGLKYGENQINPSNPKETQPYYYVDTFRQLYNSFVGVVV